MSIMVHFKSDDFSVFKFFLAPFISIAFVVVKGLMLIISGRT